MDWLTEAKRLPLGHKRRVQHDCGEGRDMVIGHDEIGYSAYCHRCGPVGNVKHGYRNLEELERLRELNSTAQEAHSRELPSDFTLDIPAEPSRWLLKGGVASGRARDAGIGWSPRLRRVILPLYCPRTGDVLYWQGRAVLRGQTPKYINPVVPKTDLLYRANPPHDGGGTARVVVTEDILSAIRVGAHIPAVSILGTKTSDAQAAQLAEYDKVDYWLDPDQAGIDGTVKGRRKLALVTETGAITSPVDPKNLSDREIREALKLTPNHRYTYYDYRDS